MTDRARPGGSLVVKQDDGGRFRFNLIDEHGRVLMSSTAYPTAEAAGAAVDAARRLMADAEVVDQSQPGQAVRPRSAP